MREVFEVGSDKAGEAEQILKKDDLVGRQSIAVRNPAILEIKCENVFIIIDGSEDSIKKAKELLKGVGAKKSGKKKEVLKKYDEMEDRTAEGFGAILGG